MQTYKLKRREEIKLAGEPQLNGKASVQKLRLVTVAEGLSWAEAKRQRNLDSSLEIVPERQAVPAPTSAVAEAG